MMARKALPKPGVEEYAEWYSDVLRAVFYSDSETDLESYKLNAPKGFEQWIDSLPEEVERQAKRLHALYDDMCEAAKDFIVTSRNPTVESFDEFTRQFEQFITHLQRFQVDESASKIGRIDPVTGLRTEIGMYDDLMREVERRNRKGTPVSLAVCAIDDYLEFSTQESDDNVHAVLNQVGEAIRNALRSFDDIYYTGDGSFVLCLKHTELMDAYLISDRLRENIEERSFGLPNGSIARVTISCGVSEPLPGEEHAKFTGSAYDALKRAQEQGGNTVAQHEEVSPLMQFAKNKQD